MNMPDWLVTALTIFNHAIVYYFIGLNTIYLGLFLLSLGAVRKFIQHTFFSDYQHLQDSEMSWPVSILVAAHNEEKSIVETVRCLTKVNYSKFEIIVINDGSTDETLRRLIDEFGLRRVDPAYRKSLRSEQIFGVYAAPDRINLVVVDKAKGGKADSLNCGINLSRYPLVCSIDADSLIEPNALSRVVKPFLEYPDETIAVGGIVRIVNGCTVDDGGVSKIALPNRSLPILQAVEYLRAFLMGRVGWNALQSLLIISGAFGLYKKQVLIDAGGFSTKSDTEDLELVVRLHRHMREEDRKYRITFVPDPVCWTEVPTTLRDLMRQRIRWHRGLIETLWKNRTMFFNRRYGTVGTFAFPYFFTFEMLGPFIEVLGYISVFTSYYLDILDVEHFRLFLAVSILYGIFLSVSAILLEELSFRRYPSWLDLSKLVVFGIFENFGYRQILTIFKVKAFVDILLRRRKWGAIERIGYNNEFPTPAKKPVQ